jgi:hypothetical protein
MVSHAIVAGREALRRHVEGSGGRVAPVSEAARGSRRWRKPVADPVSADEFEHAWRIIAHRAPEAVDYVVSFEVLVQMIETINMLAARLQALQDTVDAILGVDEGIDTRAA